MYLCTALLFASLASGQLGITYHRSDAEAETLARPTAAQRNAAAARAATDLGELESSVRHTSFWLLGSTHPIVARFQSSGDVFNLTLEDPKVYAGLSTALTADGYLITAAHMVRPYMRVIGWSEGKQMMAPVRLVHQETSSQPGAEYAILEVEGLKLEPLEWGTVIKVGQKLYASVGEQKGLQRREIYGEVVSRAGSATTSVGRVVATDLPFFRGDSGGGVFTEDGRFVGIIICFFVPWDSEVVSRLILAPSQQRVSAIIDNDRKRQR